MTDKFENLKKTGAIPKEVLAILKSQKLGAKKTKT